MDIDFRALVVIMMSAALVNNYVLRQFLGVCPFLGVSKDLKSSVGMGFAVMFVMLLAASVTWPIQVFLLDTNDLRFMQTVVFILVIATLVQLVEVILKKYSPSLFESLGVYLPLMTTNCAVLAVTISNINNGYTYIEAVVSALGAGLGFFLAMVIFTGVREHTASADPPEAFKGIPLILITAAILSLAFFGFEGVIENLFGQ
ncbi:MAG: RnfABCDGE type electron transport complex subunit A [Oscillospiraceae bacterium]|jgi:electron transport complex protein RnfA|nr:RnfABCDGE type electron transport complex subunit A [Oscillospiraceae bacterium]